MMNKHLLYIIFFIFILKCGVNDIIWATENEYLENDHRLALAPSCFSLTPNELILEIFNKFNNKESLKVRQVCRLFKTLLDTHKLILPKEDDLLIQIIDNSPGKIPDQLIIPHWLEQDGKISIANRERLSSCAFNHYRCHYEYYTPEQRERSSINLDHYCMLMYVTFQLGDQEAFKKLKCRLNVLRDELLEYYIHLPHCSPVSPALWSEIYAFLCEQIARINPLERSSLALAYKEGDKVPQDLPRSQYWETYKTNYDFPSDLFDAKLFKDDE